jgi:membrane dipeptidase
MIARIPPVPLSVVLGHVDHMVRVAGIDHVGALGSDFDGISATPEGLDDVTALPRIAQALLDRGYSEADVKKVFGGNMMRVMQQVLDRAAAPD